MELKLTKVYTRLYSDTHQLKAYVEWSDGSRTEGDAYAWAGKRHPKDSHMTALFARAERDGLEVQHETW